MVNIALLGTGYYWNENQTDTSNSHRYTSSSVNDNNTNTTADTVSNCITWRSYDYNEYDGAGVVFANSTNNITSVEFVNGDLRYGEGYFRANCKLQFSSDGTSWTNASDWSIAPAYPYNSTAANKSYVFSGPVKNNIKGIRVVGQIAGSGCSWPYSGSFRVREFRVWADTKAPTIPQGLQMLQKTKDSVKISWQASQDNVRVTAYDVYKNGILAGSTSVTGAPEDTNYTINGLNPASSYSFTIKARDAVQNSSDFSSPLSVVTLPDISVPANLQATSITANSLTLSWTASTGNLAGYDIYQNGNLIGQSTGASFGVTGLTASTTYSFTVKARDPNGIQTEEGNSISVSTTSASGVVA